MKIFNNIVISKLINSRRLQWLGHLERMNYEREVKRIAWKITARRKDGTSRKRWKELDEKQIKDYKKIAKNLKYWKKTQKWFSLLLKNNYGLHVTEKSQI